MLGKLANLVVFKQDGADLAVQKKQKIQEILTQASKSGLKPEEIADRLGVSLSE